MSSLQSSLVLTLSKTFPSHSTRPNSSRVSRCTCAAREMVTPGTAGRHRRRSRVCRRQRTRKSPISFQPLRSHPRHHILVHGLVALITTFTMTVAAAVYTNFTSPEQRREALRLSGLKPATSRRGISGVKTMPLAGDSRGVDRRNPSLRESDLLDTDEEDTASSSRDTIYSQVCDPAIPTLSRPASSGRRSSWRNGRRA